MISPDFLSFIFSLSLFLHLLSFPFIFHLFLYLVSFLYFHSLLLLPSFPLFSLPQSFSTFLFHFIFYSNILLSIATRYFSCIFSHSILYSLTCPLLICFSLSNTSYHHFTSLSFHHIPPSLSFSPLVTFSHLSFISRLFIFLFSSWPLTPPARPSFCPSLPRHSSRSDNKH